MITTTELAELRIEAAKPIDQIASTDDGECVGCGRLTIIGDGKEWSDGDWCYECCCQYAHAVREKLPKLLDEIEFLRGVVEATELETMFVRAPCGQLVSRRKKGDPWFIYRNAIEVNFREGREPIGYYNLWSALEAARAMKGGG